MPDLRGARALITGAGSGIGRAVALSLAGRGVHLCLTGRRPRPLEEVAREAARAGAPEPLLHTADLASEADIEELAARVAGELAGLEVLVHSAGAYGLGPVASAPVADLDMQYAVNLRAPFLLTQHALALLRKSRGQVVFVNSTAGRRGHAGVSQYAATKHGLKALADCLREEERSTGVRVLTVYPGRTATPMQEHVHRLEGRPYDPSRWLRPEDVAATVLHVLELPPTAEVHEIEILPARGA